MGKVLLWLGVALGLMFVMRLIAHNKAKQRNPFEQNRKNKPQSKRSWSNFRGPTEQMLACDHCGVHLPQSEATMTDTGNWCSNDHARLGRRAP
jgi:uncharacterized protein